MKLVLKVITCATWVSFTGCTSKSGDEDVGESETASDQVVSGGGEQIIDQDASSSGESDSDAEVQSAVPEVDPCDPDSQAPEALSGLVLTGSPSETAGVSASWDAAVDNCQVSHIEVSLGTSAGDVDVVDWMSIGNGTSYQFVDGLDGVSLTLNPGQDYFMNFKIVDDAGLESTVVSSDSFSYFDPRAISGLQVWLDAQDFSGDGTSFLDDDVFSSDWVDKSGFGNDYSLVAGPVYRETAIGGFPSVEVTSGGFDGPAGAALDADGEWSLIYVAQKLASDADGRLIDAASGNYLVGYHDIHTQSIYLSGNPSEYNSGVATTTGNEDPQYFALTRDALGNLNWYGKDGLIKTWGSSNTAAGVVFDILTGAYSHQRSHAWVGEFIVYDRELTSQDWTSLESYLRARWGF